MIPLSSSIISTYLVLHHHYNGIDYVLKAHRFQAKEENGSLSEYQLLCVFINNVGNIITLALFAKKVADLDLRHKSYHVIS